MSDISLIACVSKLYFLCSLYPISHEIIINLSFSNLCTIFCCTDFLAVINYFYCAKGKHDKRRAYFYGKAETSARMIRCFDHVYQRFN